MGQTLVKFGEIRKIAVHQHKDSQELKALLTGIIAGLRASDGINVGGTYQYRYWDDLDNPEKEEIIKSAVGFAGCLKGFEFIDLEKDEISVG